MKVLMVTNIYPTDAYPGRGSFVKGQIDSIKKEGIDVTVKYINAIDYKAAFLKGALDIFKNSFTEQFDLIHAHYGTTGIVSRMQWRKPVVVSYLGSDLLGNPKSRGPDKTPSSQLIALLGRANALVVDAVIVKSRELRHKISRKNRVFIIPNGVNFQLFQPMDNRSARKQLDLDFRKKYVLFPSNAEWPRKRYSLAVEAVQILKRQGMPVDLITIYGQPQSRVPLFMNACDAMIMTSLWEGSPNVIKESMACNLPIVSVDVGDVSEVIHGCEGCFIVPRKAEAVAEKLKTILINPFRTMGRDYIAHLEIQQVAKRIIRIYQRLLRHRST